MRALAIIAAVAFKVGFAVYLMTDFERRLWLTVLIVSFVFFALMAVHLTFRAPKHGPELFCAVGEVGGQQMVIPCEFKLRSAESLRYEAPT